MDKLPYYYKQDEFTPTELRLLAVRRRIDTTRANLNDAHTEFQQLLADNPKIAAMWSKFELNGGVDHDELRLFLKGELRPRITVRRGKLRLVSKTRFVTHKRMKQYDDDDGSGPDAA